MSYLTESNLESIIKELYPNNTFIRNKSIPNFKYKWRPDFRNDDLMIIIEFDGYLHYTQTNTIRIDKLKDIEYAKLGYKVIRIPYFIQISTDIIKLLFNIDYEYEQIYPHGFIDSKVILPHDFCVLGLIKYKQDLIKFDICKNNIEKSLYGLDYHYANPFDEINKNLNVLIYE